MHGTGVGGSQALTQTTEAYYSDECARSECAQSHLWYGNVFVRIDKNYEPERERKSERAYEI